MTKRLSVFLLTLLLAGCIQINDDKDGEADGDATTTEQAADDKAAPEGFAGVTEALNQAQQALSGNQDGEEIEVLDFRVLKEQLPEEAGDLERTDATGERTSAFGIKFSQATGQYEGDGGQMDLTIIDMGTLTGAAMLGYAWLQAEFDRESDQGYERTLEFEGYPAFQKFENDGQRFEMQVVIGQRIIVQAEGQGMEMDEVEEVVGDVVDDVKGLVPQGA